VKITGNAKGLRRMLGVIWQEMTSILFKLLTPCTFKEKINLKRMVPDGKNLVEKL
jgi:hypothetical protein